MKDKRIDRRNKNYKQLREVGYSSYEANKYKDRSKKVVKSLINIKKDFNEYKEKITEVKKDRSVK